MKKILLIAAALFAVIACQKPIPEDAQIFTLESQEKVNVGPESSNIVISFKSNKAWEISSVSDWITPETVKGEGQADVIKVNVAIAENEGAERSDKVIIKSLEKTLEVTISQSLDPTIKLISEKECVAAKVDTTITIKFQSNGAWTAKSNVEWASVSPASGEGSKEEQTVSCTFVKGKFNADPAAIITIAGVAGGVDVNVTYTGIRGLGISTVADLEELSDSVNVNGSINKWIDWDGVVFLNNDLDFQGGNHTPIGNSGTNSFKAIFDGQGHSIKNLKYSKNDREYQGIFGVVGNTKPEDKGVIKNLIIDSSCSFNGAYEGTGGSTLIRLSAICGLLNHYSEIRNCINYANVTLENSGPNKARRVGGICASSKGSIYNCENYGNITSETTETEKITTTSQFNFGGVCGFMGEGNNEGVQHLENCKNYGKITIDLSNFCSRSGNDYNNVGGVIGYCCGVYNADNKVYTERNYVKNIENHGEIIVTAPNATTVKSYQRIGGCIGYLLYSECDGATNYADMNILDVPLTNGGGFRIGGVVGYMNDVDGSPIGGILKNATNAKDAIRFILETLKAKSSMIQAGAVLG